MRIDTPLDAGLIEMLSAVPGERFTIRAEVRIDWNRDGRGKIGVYCRHAAATTAAGPQHLLEGLFLSGDTDANLLKAVLQPRWYGAALAPAERHQREISPAYHKAAKQRYVREVPGVRFGPAPGSTIQVSSHPDQSPSPPTKVQHMNSKTGERTDIPDSTGDVWWELTVSVAPDGTTATWEPAGGLPLGPVTAADRRPILDEARRRYSDVATTDPGRWNGTGVGLYAASVRCTVRKFELTLDSGD